MGCVLGLEGNEWDEKGERREVKIAKKKSVTKFRGCKEVFTEKA